MQFMADTLPRETPEVLVCVTDRRQCAELIRRSNAFAREKRARVRVLCVTPHAETANYEALEEQFTLCQQIGAMMTVVFSVKAIPTILRVAKSKGVHYIVVEMGGSAQEQSEEMAFRIAALLPGARVYIPEGTGLRPAVSFDQRQFARRA